ncbi:DUF3857 domain-containing protein [Sphingobacterium pedocola]|uniref:DUF3857 domain-containing protein n=1 Tax=Sphingobacterium pedocola TaxID=2082722 RepID=A0ABR9TB56_9SPHI|nr:DUF3857 domain-containing protein [Sphingobacterium pedocola]MBE8722583.1 hypothetical protein [Sphingobacterium pedocola]
MRIISLLLGVLFSHSSFGQLVELDPIRHRDFSVDYTQLDSNARAVVISELGKTTIDLVEAERSIRVLHRYAIRIKINKKEGYDKANFSLPLYKYGGDFETIQDIKAKTYNLTENKINISELKNKDIYTENKTPFVKLSKFTLPDVREGSVIDIEYTIISPNIFNYKKWEFQSDIPKLKSTYTAIIPALYKYNVTLRGALKLEDVKSKVLRECFRVGGAKADCSELTYSMKNIPAFEEEDYMLSPQNYISAINFEMEEAQHLNGAKQTYTKKWSDVDRELMTEKEFGGQIKKTKFFLEALPDSILSQTDLRLKAKSIYSHIQARIKWNNMYGKYSQFGVEESYEKRSGNVADINFSLIAALNAANIEAYPVLVSTRENSLPNSLHPVLTDFNYVIVGVKLDNETILADASENFLPFGELPLRCINEKGRIIFSRKSSEWIPLENKTKSLTSYSFDGELDLSTKLIGSLTITYDGLDALRKRKEISGYPSVTEYEEKLDERLTNISLTNLNIQNLENLDLLLSEQFDVIVDVGNGHIQPKTVFNLNPIFIDRITRNPFNLDDRTYPVDLGSQREEKHNFSIVLPEGITVQSGPKTANLTLPDGAARYVYKNSIDNNVLMIQQSLSLNKAVFNTDEYFFLKELFSRAIQHLKVDYILKYNNE